MTEKKPPRKLLKKLALVFAAAGAVLGIGAGVMKMQPPAVVAVINPDTAATPKITAAFNGKSWRELQQAAPKGDGHPVLVVPGFLTNDAYMSTLQSRIREQGYAVYGWDDGFNVGADKTVAGHLAARLKEIYAENGNKKVSLIGYSLGGVYARELARQYPDMVRNVITLSSPFGLKDARVDSINGFYGGTASPEATLAPPPVPTTAVYSRSDMVVDWRTALNAKAPQAENIEVHGGHVLMPFNAEVTAVVLDRLAEADTRWQPLAAKFTP